MRPDATREPAGDPGAGPSPADGDERAGSPPDTGPSWSGDAGAESPPDAGPSRSGDPAAAATALRILLVYATRHGSTSEVADAVAEELRAAGHEVDLRPAAGAPGPAGYDAVVVGGPMIMGWHREAVRFVARHREALAERPLAFFITAASLTEGGENEVHGVPIVKDPWLAKVPRDAAKLRSKERYARPAHYLDGVLKKGSPARPRVVAFFAGSLDLTTMNVLEKLFVLLVVGATPGDGRNWKAIREWGAGLGDALRA